MYRNISDSIYTIVLYLRRKATCPPYFRNFWLEYKTRVASSTLAARFSITDCKCNQPLRMLETGPVARVLCQPSVICYGGRCVPPPSGKDDPWSLGGVESRVLAPVSPRHVARKSTAQLRHRPVPPVPPSHRRPGANAALPRPRRVQDSQNNHDFHHD